MPCLGFKKINLKNAIAYFAWFCVLLSTYLPAPVRGDLCVTADDELERRNRTAFVVAGLTVIGIAAGIVFLTTASGHHKHHERYSAMSSVDNYRPYSYSSSYHSHSSSSHSHSSSSDSYSYSDYSSDHHHNSHHHHHHHSGYYSSNPYSIFSENDASSWSGDSDSYNSDRLAIRTKSSKTALSKSAAREESSLSGQFIAHSSSGQEGNLTVFVQLPDGTSRSLGTASLSGNASLPYGPFHQKGVYTFGASLDQGNASSSQMNMGSIQIEVNGSTVQKHDFTAPPHAPASYEPAPCCFELS